MAALFSIMIEERDLQQYSNLELLARQVVEGFITGLHKSPFHGFSVEFAEHRLYNTGESTKHIDWKLFARTDKLFVKRYEEETNLRCQIIIDNSSSMYFPEDSATGNNKINFSVKCAAALTYLLGKQRDATGLSIFNEKVNLHTPAKSSSVHHRLLFNELEKISKPAKSDVLNHGSAVAHSLHQIAESIHKRSLVIIFSDMMESYSSNDEMFSALHHLKHNKHEVILFHVHDKSKELEFNYENRPYNFIDMESGEEVKLHPNAIKENYLNSVKEARKQLMLNCSQYRIDFVEADINESVNQVLLAYLIKRGRMH